MLKMHSPRLLGSRTEGLIHCGKLARNLSRKSTNEFSAKIRFSRISGKTNVCTSYQQIKARNRLQREHTRNATRGERDPYLTLEE
jgi:hypothetical protein